jgi:XRE family transcriptional regulator, regulator of sulfur utilization
MLTKRDFFVALIAASFTLCTVAFVRAGAPVMGSAVFDWNKLEAKPTNVGQTRKVFQAPTATLDELECHITTLNPGVASHPPHKHPDEELLVIKEGTVESLVNGQWQRLGPGSIIFQAANQEHTIRNAGTTTATYHVFKWNSPGMLKAKAATKPQDE